MKSPLESILTAMMDARKGMEKLKKSIEANRDFVVKDPLAKSIAIIYDYYTFKHTDLVKNYLHKDEIDDIVYKKSRNDVDHIYVDAEGNEVKIPKEISLDQLLFIAYMLDVSYSATINVLQSLKKALAYSSRLTGPYKSLMKVVVANLKIVGYNGDIPEDDIKDYRRHLRENFEIVYDNVALFTGPLELFGRPIASSIKYMFAETAYILEAYDLSSKIYSTLPLRDLKTVNVSVKNKFYDASYKALRRFSLKGEFENAMEIYDGLIRAKVLYPSELVHTDKLDIEYFRSLSLFRLGRVGEAMVLYDYILDKLKKGEYDKDLQINVNKTKETLKYELKVSLALTGNTSAASSHFF